jgi:hypothetical protein
MKTLIWIAALGATLLIAPPAFAGAPFRKACAADIKAQCADVRPGGGAIRACVFAHFPDLSAGCRAMVKDVRAANLACRTDIEQFCVDIKPGRSAIADCIRSHSDDLSDQCKNAMAKIDADAE